MRMMLVGAGAVGESMLKILKWRDPKGEWLSYVLVGDYDLSRAEAVAGLLADDRFSAVQINATDKEQMKSPVSYTHLHEEKYEGKEDADVGDEQFEINDDRSFEKMYEDMEHGGLQPVLNDYIYV